MTTPETSFKTDPSMDSNRYSDGLLHDELWMDGMSHPRHHSIEPVVLVSSVLDNADGTIRLGKGVLALNHIPDANFRLFLLVTSLGILHSVFELVVGWGLRKETKKSTGVGRQLGYSRGSRRRFL
jgi:hypothetical protein